MSDSPEHPAAHPAEPHVGGLGQKLNWLRAGVLGANDGIVTTAGLRRSGSGDAAYGPNPDRRRCRLSGRSCVDGLG